MTAQTQELDIVPEAGSADKPASNLIETWGSYSVQLALPGVDLTSLVVNVVGRDLQVSGKYRIPRVESGSAIWTGIPNAEFSYAFTLPSAVDGDQGIADYWHGILSVTLPKVSHLRSQSIPVSLRE